MMTPTSVDLYERLGVGGIATASEIKAAFFSGIRKYPPEKDPHNYKLIREAYDTLTNEISRAEYDSKKEFGEEIDFLLQEIRDAEEEENQPEAIRLLKRIINLAPNIGIHRNRLGLHFLEIGEASLAKKQFEKCRSIDPRNTTYIINIGYAEKHLENYYDAEKLFRQAWQLDEEDYAAPRALAQVLYDLDRIDEAHYVLDKAIEADGKIDFQDFFCIYDKVHFYLFANDIPQLGPELKRIIDISRSQDEKEFAAYLLYKSGVQLYDYNAFELAEQFAEAAHKLDPQNEPLLKFHRESRKHSRILTDFSQLMESDQIHPFSKHLISVYSQRYYGEIEDEEFEEKTNEIINIIENVMNVDPDSTEIKKSLRYIKEHHLDIFNMNERFFNSLLNYPPANDYLGPCVYCGEKVRVGKSTPGNYGCPHCKGALYYDMSGFKQGRHTTSSGCLGSIVFIIGSSILLVGYLLLN